MGFNIEKPISSRAFSDKHTALFVKTEGGKYRFFLPVTNMPATGSAPEQVEKTVTTDVKKTYIEGRQDNPQKEFSFYAGRDNFRAIRELKKEGDTFDFLQVNPDCTGYKFSGSIASYQDETSVGSNLTAKLVITVSESDEEYSDNVYDLLQDTITFTGAIPSKLVLAKSGTKTFSVATNPSTATVGATSETTGVATASASEHDVTITATTQAGSSVVEITATSEGLTTAKATVLVIVEE